MHNRRNETTYKGNLFMNILELILFDLYIDNYGYDHILKHYQYFNKQIKKEINNFLCSEFRDYRKAIYDK